jgi:hypothetical protein
MLFYRRITVSIEPIEQALLINVFAASDDPDSSETDGTGGTREG